MPRFTSEWGPLQHFYNTFYDDDGELKKPPKLPTLEEVVKKLFPDETFRSDVLYHSVPAMAGVAGLSRDEIIALGGEDPHDIGHLFITAGVLIDENRSVIYTSVLSDEVVTEMKEVAAKNPQVPWGVVKRVSFVNYLLQSDSETQSITPQCSNSSVSGQTQGNVVSSSV